jgi:hypothetical protein
MEPAPPNPYATPETLEAPPEPGPVHLPPGPFGPYRDNRLLARWLIGLLVFGILVQVARATVNFIYVLTDWFGDADLAARIESAFALTGLTGLACMIVFGVWIVRSSKNAWLIARRVHDSTPGRRAFRTMTLLDDTPGWAVGWYFVPIANFWKPYVAMRQIVRASTLKVGLANWLLPCWWTLWILAQFSDRATRIFARKGADWEAAEQLVVWTSASGIDIALHTVAILLVRGVTDLQTGSAAALAAADREAPASG